MKCDVTAGASQVDFYVVCGPCSDHWPTDRSRSKDETENCSLPSYYVSLCIPTLMSRSLGRLRCHQTA